LEPGDAPLAVLRKMPLIFYTERHQMGRMIADHLARQNLRLNYRFELDSYNAIMAMVASGAGWTILTPLALRHARRFQDRVRVEPLPFPPLSRTISLTARKRVLEEMPGQTAARLRPLLEELVVGPSVAAFPWLKDKLRLVEGAAGKS
jgi:DNA-binding transcriptional LysR family regulator